MSGYKNVPNIIQDSKGNTFAKGQYLGKGTFGRCYTLRYISTDQTFAGKCLHKETLNRFNVNDKITQEISIQKKLAHKNIVGFIDFTEDKSFIYIILELCVNRSMTELIKRRKYITSFEAKYFMKQIISGVQYLHDQKIVHRDLKLGNLLISHNMEIKIGDFGLAVKLTKDKNKRHSLCGTPNYIAPEVLNRQYYSYEVDIWAIGCILFTLLVGVPPFQTNTKEETFQLISRCEFYIPKIIRKCAANFIVRTLQKDPKNRPVIHELAQDDFLNMGFIPDRLPTTCVIMPPRTNMLVHNSGRKRPPLRDVNSFDSSLSNKKLTDVELNELLNKIQTSIEEIMSNCVSSTDSDDEAEDPTLQPFIWVNAWIDYTHRYGFGFKYNDNSTGALYNDGSTLMLLPSGKNGYYIEEGNSSTEMCFSADNVPAELEKKMKVLRSFRKFMFNNLKNAYEAADEVEPLSVLPVLTNWINTREVTAMYLSNATFQINFLNDHLKLIICPIMEAVTVITNGNQLRTFQIKILKLYGCSPILRNKLSKTCVVVKNMLKDNERRRAIQ